MTRSISLLAVLIPSLLILALLAPVSAGAQSRPYCGTLFACDEPPEEFSEVFAIIEINSTDGDAGFHAKYDGGPWVNVLMIDPDGNVILDQAAAGGLGEQQITENFFESAEPLCETDPEEPDEEVVTFAEFLERFPEGSYMFVGESGDGELIVGETEFSYNIPAAPDISATEDVEFAADETVVVSWAPGSDLGEKCHDQSLIDDGIIPDPTTVEVVGWELVIESDNDEASDPPRVLSVQTPPGQTSVSIPDEFFAQFLEDGFNVFKFEVGAKEETGNQIFSEGTFTIECPTCPEDEEE